jgi:hypothetical protein
MTEQLALDSPQDKAQAEGPVECLGMTFENDEKRREYFLEKLRGKLQDPEFRKTEGFPIGADEDILAMSDPPYYTACPNPFIEDFIRCYSKPYDPNESYGKEPFAADVSEGKNDPIYNAHAYHTKVPHKAIMRYILHYTEPGDIVFDGFCGTGMTGVAAQLCNDRIAVESLGYRVNKDGTIYQQETDEHGKVVWRTFSKLGSRSAILNDLSPAATFIAYNYNTPIDVKAFEHEAEHIFNEVKNECGWMYETIHIDGKTRGRINYTVWSDVFICPECAHEVIFWEAAVDKEAGRVHDEFPCPYCDTRLTKRAMDRAWVIKFDKDINQTIRQAKQVQVLINYSIGTQRFEKSPDAFDIELMKKIETSDIPYWFPTNQMPKGFNTEQPKVSHGLTHAHHFFTTRNLWTFSCLYHHIKTPAFLLTLLDGFSVTTKLSRFRVPAWVQKTTGPMKGLTAGTLYAPSLPGEQSCLNVFHQKTNMVVRSQFESNICSTQIETASASCLHIPDDTVDYIFTDPPFGGNLMYSELNFLSEAWLKVFTNNEPEAIENGVQGKGLVEYQQLMTRCFQEYHRILKPGRWMTVEFHNSKNSV